ncbi:MAG: hypothetical protein V3U76_08530 [Granulosicoccus sp.]
MIWIATICLLAIAAWLFFNALNERRWVEAHSHDDAVAADKGLFPSFSKPEDTYSVNQESTGIGKRVAKIRQKTTDMGNKLEQTAAVSDGGGIRDKMRIKENSMLGGLTAKADAIENKIKSGSRQVYKRPKPTNTTRNELGVTARVNRHLEEVENKVQIETQRASNR